MQDTANLRMPKGSRALTKAGRSPPMFMEIRLVSGKKFDILVEGAFAFVKHGTPFSISISFSQLGGTAASGLLFSSKTSSSFDASETASNHGSPLQLGHRQRQLYLIEQ